MGTSGFYRAQQIHRRFRAQLILQLAVAQAMLGGEFCRGSAADTTHNPILFDHCARHPGPDQPVSAQKACQHIAPFV